MDTPDPGPGVSLADYINQTYNNPVNSVDVDWRSPEQKKQDEQQQQFLDQQNRMNTFNQRYGGGSSGNPQEGGLHKAVSAIGGSMIAGGVASAAAGGSFAAGAMGALAAI